MLSFDSPEGFIIVIYKARQPLAAVSPETRKIAYIQYSQMGSFSQSSGNPSFDANIAGYDFIKAITLCLN